MSEQDQRDLCAELDVDMSGYSKFDLMMLTRALKTSYVIAKAHMNGDTDNGYIELRRAYSTYACQIKFRIQDASNHRLIANNIIYVLFMLLSVWVIYQMGKQIYYAIMMKPVSITIINALIVIILMNPFFSFITVTMEIMNYNPSSAVPSKNSTDIETLEALLKDAVTSEANFEQKAGAFVKAFENSELFVTLDTQRMERITQIRQFVQNHKTFLEKSENPNADGQLRELVKEAFEILIGRNTKALTDMFDSDLTSHTEGTTQGGMYYKTSKQVREHTPEILNYLDPNIEASDIGNYAKYFLDDLNNYITRLVGYVTQHSMFLNMGVFCSIEGVSLYSPVDKTDAILESFAELSKRVRRLKMLNLPEYEYLITILNSKNQQGWTDMLLNFDPQMANKRDLYTIIEMFINNTTYFFSIPSDAPEKCNIVERVITKRIDGVSYDITAPSLICDLTPNVNRCLTIDPSIDSFDIRELYSSINANYLNADSTIYANTNKLINSLKTKALDKDFRTRNRMEVDILTDVLDTKFESLEWTVDQSMVVVHDLADAQIEDMSARHVFVHNVQTVFEELKIRSEEHKVTSELTYDRRREIENPANFVSFDQFNNKLESMNKAEYMKLHKSILETEKSVAFFNDRMDEINNSMERQIYIGNTYWKYILIYYMVSFLLLGEYVWKYYTGNSVDIALLKKLEVRRLNNKRT